MQDFEDKIRDAIEAIRIDGDHDVAMLDMLDDEMQNADERLASRLRRMVESHQARREELLREVVGLALSHRAGRLNDRKDGVLPLPTDRVSTNSKASQLPHEVTPVQVSQSGSDPLKLYGTTDSN